MRNVPFWRQITHAVLASLISLVVVLAIVGGVLFLALHRSPEVPKDGWLVIDLHESLPEYAPPGSFPGGLMGGDTLTLQDALDALAKASLDRRTRGVIWKLSAGNGAGWAKLQELRQATAAVRQAGKPVYAWADNLDLRTLYLAAACDSIYMPRGGYFSFQGLRRESMHVKGTLDKLGIVPHVSKIREYKAAAELVMETETTPLVKERNQRMLDELWATVSGTIADDRGLVYADLLALLEHGALEPSEAADAGVIDRVLYWQGLEARLLAEAHDPKAKLLPTVSPATYRDVAWKDLGRKGKATVAVVHAQGMIGGRENGTNPVFGITMGHESVVRELQRARLDPDVAAIVFRVDSPGGDGLTSDLIGHEVALCADAKPTVVSMVDVAASGGYQISFRATRLLADPLSVVGSIGSISAFFDLSGWYRKIGLSKDGVEAGPMAGLGRDDRAPTAQEWAAFTASHYAGFNDWLQQVADKRGLTFAEMEERAYGRIFHGEEAVRLGLIDGIGNLDQAVRLAAELAEIAPETPLTVVHLPERQSTLDQLLGHESGPADPVALAVRWRLFNQLRSEWALTRQLAATDAVLEPVPR
ncbi:MAG: S49 family peptidase [Candidatus Krumholzibacteriia bacterium]